MSKIRFGPDGIHLFNRATGQNILIDEISLPKETWTESPRQVSIALTNSCDLNCTHCYAPKTNSKLETSLVKEWMLELDQNSCFGVGFGGGEPLLHPDIVDICDYGSQNTNQSISITSHAHLFTKSLIHRLSQSVNFMRVSMDGTYSTYEKIRGRSFSEFLKKLSLLKGQIPFGINFVVNDFTFKDLDAAAKIAEEYGASEMLLLPEKSVGRGREISTSGLTQLKIWIESFVGRLRLSLSSSHQSLTDSHIPLIKEDMLKSFAHIDASAILKPNSFETSGVTIGSKGFMVAYRKMIRKVDNEDME